MGWRLGGHPFPSLRQLVAVGDRRCAEKRCQFLDGHCYCLTGLSSDRDSRFGMNRIDHQLLAPTIKRGIDPANELIARRDGHDVVPEPPFVFGHVDLALIGEVEEAGCATRAVSSKSRDRKGPR